MRDRANTGRIDNTRPMVHSDLNRPASQDGRIAPPSTTNDP